MCDQTLRHEAVLTHILEADVSCLKWASGRSLVCPQWLSDTQRRCLALTLAYEFLFGKPSRIRSGDTRWVRDVRQLKAALFKQKQLCIDEGMLTTDGCLVEDSVVASAPLQPSIPRYARINTLVTTTDAVLSELRLLGWNPITPFDQNGILLTRKRYQTLLANLEKTTVAVDRDVTNVLAFPTSTDLHDNSLVLSGKLLLQDKASCLPVHCLNPDIGSTVIDACAAPGMKTSHAAAFVGPTGRVFAFDKSKERTDALRKIVDAAGAFHVTVENNDFLRVDVDDEKYKQAEYVLVDPPCSGSGIVSRKTLYQDTTVDPKRLNSLGNLQAMLLKQAMRLPAAKRIVYSTCSVMERENEAVVEEVLLDATCASFQLVYAMPGWKHRGRKRFEFGKKCLRASPDKDFTNGFFVAVFERPQTKP